MTNIGLTSEQAKNLRQQYGYNIIPEKKESKFKLWLKQFWGPLPWLLELVAILSFYSKNVVEAIIIIALLIVNGFISIFQRSRTDEALSQLRKSLQINSRVMRDGQWVTLPTSELLPNDVVRVRAGDIISADLKIIEGNASVDQSSITGESLPVEVTNNSPLYSGSTLVRGEATAVVTSIGLKTKFGLTANLLETSHPPTHMEQLIFTIIKYQFSFNILLIIIVTSFILLAHGNEGDIVPIAIVLLITSVPIAFPTMFTVSQTFGASQLAHLNNNKGILVRRLSAVQDCSTMNVLCTDKTGTLTKNSLSIVKISLLSSYSADEVLALAASCSNSSDQDPIDKALIDQADERNLRLFNQKKFIPFDPLTKKTQATIDYKKGIYIVNKGLPSIIAKDCSSVNLSFKTELASLSEAGFRVIAVSLGRTSGKQTLVGLIAFEDPIREDSKPLIQELMKLGIDVKMITGDNIKTAVTIANKLGMEVKALTTEELQKNPSLALTHNVFAEAYPKDKLLIITELQKAGYTVGMTGDGVNDSPALHQAEVGIAVSKATDIAKSSASYILTNPGLGDIVTAVKISREVYQRIRTWALNKIIKSFEIAILIVFSYLITRNVILTPLLGVLFLFANDFVTISISTDNSVAESKPANWRLSKMIFSSVTLAVVLLVILYISLALSRHYYHLSLPQLSTLTFLLLVFQGQASLYSLRSWPHFWTIKPSRTILTATILVMIVLLIAAFSGLIISQIPLALIGVIVIVPIVSLLTTDFIKHHLPISDRT